MGLSDDINQIIHRLEEGKGTVEDINYLRERLIAGDREITSQLSKYNVNIGDGKEIHIGDRIYQQWDEKAIKALVKAIQKVSSIHQNTDSGDAAGRDIDKRKVFQNCTFIQLLAGDTNLGNDSQEFLNNFDFSGIPQESIQQAYQDALPPDANVWDLEGNELSQILKKLEEFRQLPEFLTRLSQDKNVLEENPYRLRDLVKKIALKKTYNRNKNERFSDHFNHKQKQFKAYLMATIEHYNDGDEHFLVNAWLNIDNLESVKDLSNFESLLDKDEQQQGTICNFKDIPKQLNNFLKKSLKHLRNKQYQLIIEVFLPSDLIGTEVDSWKIYDPIADEINLGIKYPIRLRSIERLHLEYLDSYLSDWYKNWDNVRTVLNNKPSQELFEHLEEMESFNWKILKNNLKEKIGLKVTCALPKARTKELFKAILTATTPIAIWIRCDLPNLDQVVAINKVLTFKPLCHLCESVRETREKADAVQMEEHLGFHLAILWENPYRLTPDVMIELKTPGQ